VITFTIITLGHIKHRINVDRIRSWPSKLFKISGISACTNIPDGKVGWQQFTDDDLDFVRLDTNADITVAITEYALEENYYIRRITSGVVVLSLYEVADVLGRQNIPIEHFIIRNLYEIAMLFLLYGSLQPTRTGVPSIIHDETRSCLFDMNGLKCDVEYSTSKPSICSQCHAALSRSQLPNDTLRKLEKELKRIRKPLYHRIVGFVKQRPILSLWIAIVAGIILELVGNGLYDVLIRIFSRSGS